MGADDGFQALHDVDACRSCLTYGSFAGTVARQKGGVTVEGDAAMGQHLQLPSVRFVSSPRGRVIPECRGCPECDCPLGREIAAWVLSCRAVCKVVGSVLRRCRARRKIYSA